MVPDIYVQIVPPQNLVLNGVPSNVIGLVGTASWGPVNQPAIAGSMAEYAQTFGPVMARKFDMGTQVATAVQQGAQAFVCVRVTDSTDVAATATIQTSGMTVTARYTGSLGNTIQITLASGSKASTAKVIVAMPGLLPEVYDNIAIPGDNASWVNIAAAINNGTGPMRGPSQLVVVTAGASTNNPTLGGNAVTLASGTDGATGVTATTLVGSDTLPRQGMYALRSQGCSIGVLADSDTSTTWTTQAGFGLSEGIYMILTGPSGDTISNAVTTKSSAGLDSYGAKLMFGDWLYWQDQTNNVLRLVSPQGFTAGRLANLSPEQSSLNKQLYSVVGSQKSGLPGSGLQNVYTDFDLQTLFENGIDVISNPQPGGTYWGVRCGHNSSSNAATNGDNYTRMTNYIAATLSAGMGLFVGMVINTGLFQQVRATLLSFLGNLLQQGMLGSTTGALPYSVQCDINDNPFSRTSLGYLQADVQVQYQAINEKFIINLEGGQTVQVTTQTLPSGQPSSGTN